MAIAYTRTPSSLTVVVNFRPTVIPSSHPNFNELCKLVTERDTTEAMVAPLLDVPAAISNFTGGEITVNNGRLFYRGVEIKNNLSSLILDFMRRGQGEAAEPFKAFLVNCRNNPDIGLIDTIYDWAVKGGLPITPDGCLLAWKIVGKDYMSLHQGPRGKLRHRVGDVVSEPREECDADRNRTCSRGIHFASIEYLEKGNYGGGLGGGNRVMAVKINPADITAIPTDYNLSKGRCCKLTVVGEVEGPKVKNFYDNAGRVFSGWEEPKRPKFEVGEVWITREGNEVMVTATDLPHPFYPVRVQGAEFYVVNEQGRYLGDRREHGYDLIRRIR